MVTVVSFILVLSLLVLVHELGHYVVGRWAGAKIEEFAIGFPPRLLSVRRGETDYSINAVPLGGYCRFAGEDNPDVPGGLSAMPRGKRALILIAGVTMNALLGVVIFACLFATGYPTAMPLDGVKIGGVAAGSPAAAAGLKPGDVIVAVNGERITLIESFSAAVQAKVGKEIAFTVEREGSAPFTATATARSNPPQGEGPLGISIQQNYYVESRAYGLPQAVQMGARQSWYIVETMVSIPVMIVRGIIPAELARPVGPVGIARIVGAAAADIPTSGFFAIAQLTALLSINLALVNILPIPGLDGGRLVFVLLEWLRGGKRLSPQREGIIHFAGLMLLVGLIVVITVFDIMSPAQVGQLVP